MTIYEYFVQLWREVIWRNSKGSMTILYYLKQFVVIYILSLYLESIKLFTMFCYLICFICIELLLKRGLQVWNFTTTFGIKKHLSSAKFFCEFWINICKVIKVFFGGRGGEGFHVFTNVTSLLAGAQRYPKKKEVS